MGNRRAFASAIHLVFGRSRAPQVPSIGQLAATSELKAQWSWKTASERGVQYAGCLSCPPQRAPVVCRTGRVHQQAQSPCMRKIRKFVGNGESPSVPARRACVEASGAGRAKAQNRLGCCWGSRITAGCCAVVRREVRLSFAAGSSLTLKECSIGPRTCRQACQVGAIMLPYIDKSEDGWDGCEHGSRGVELARSWAAHGGV